MRLLSSGVLVFLSALFACSGWDRPRKSDQEPAAEFVFDRRPLVFDCTDRMPSGGVGNTFQVRLGAGNEAPYARTRSEELHLPISDVPALTITSDPSGQIVLAGKERDDWSMRFCSHGEGYSDAEAHQRLQDVSMAHVGSVVSIKNASRGAWPQARGSLLLEAPAGAPAI